jgi:hypothetical protein
MSLLRPHGLRALRQPILHLASAKAGHFINVRLKQIKQQNPVFEGFDIPQGRHCYECIEQARDDQEKTTQVLRRPADLKKAFELRCQAIVLR